MSGSRDRPKAGQTMFALSVVALLTGAMLLGGGGAGAFAQDEKPAVKKRSKSAKSGKAAAAKKKKPTTRSTAVDDKFILPYIGDNTFLIARLDVARVDLDALEQWLGQTNDHAADTLRFATAGDGEVIMPTSAGGPPVGGGMAKLRDRVGRFTKAGGRHVYMLMDGDLWSPELVFVVPLRKGADTEALTAVLKEVSEGTTNSVDTVGKALLLTSRPKIIAINARITAAAQGGKRGAASERPDLPAAFAAAGDAPLRLSLLPGESFRQMVEFGMRALPERWGGGDPQILARGTRWMTLAVQQKPTFHLAVTVQAKDAEHATKLAQRFDDGITRLKADATPDEETKALRVKHLESVKSNVQGDQVTLTLPGDFFHRGLPDTMIEAIRTRFVLIDGSERGGRAGGPPGPSAPPSPPPAPKAEPPKPKPPVAEGDGLD